MPFSASNFSRIDLTTNVAKLTLLSLLIPTVKNAISQTSVDRICTVDLSTGLFPISHTFTAQDVRDILTGYMTNGNDLDVSTSKLRMAQKLISLPMTTILSLLATPSIVIVWTNIGPTLLPIDSSTVTSVSDTIPYLPDSLDICGKMMSCLLPQDSFYHAGISFKGTASVISLPTKPIDNSPIKDIDYLTALVTGVEGNDDVSGVWPSSLISQFGRNCWIDVGDPAINGTTVLYDM